MYQLFSTDSGAIVTLVITLVIITAATIYIFSRNSKRSSLVLRREGSDRPAIVTQRGGTATIVHDDKIVGEASERRPFPVKVFRLRRGEVTDEVVHTGMMTGISRNEKTVFMRKANGVIVNRSARRVELVIN